MMTLLRRKLLNSYFVLQSLFFLETFQQRSRVIESSIGDNRNFRLICPRDSYVTTFESIFTVQNRLHHRIFKLRCTELPNSKIEATCYESPMSPPMKKFELLCKPLFYMVGLIAVPHGRKDMRFRLHCCDSQQIKFSWCTIGRASSIYGRHKSTLPRKDMLFTGFTSVYSPQEEDRDFAMHQCATVPLLFSGQVSAPSKVITRTVLVPMYQPPINFFPRPIMPQMSAQQFPQRIPFRSSAPSTAGMTTSKSSSFNDFVDDYDIIVLPPSSSITRDNFSGRRDAVYQFSPLEGETIPFKSFNIHCPIGQALKSISIRRLKDESGEDLTLVLDCRAIPLNFQPNSERSRKADFLISDDNSEQSPCVFAANEFLCGLIGVYDQIRRFSAYCCTIDNLKVKSSQMPIASIPSLAGVSLQSDASPYHFIGNLDHLHDGSFIAHLFKFENIV